MTTRIKAFDTAKHFPTQEAQARLISDAFSTGDPGYIANAFGIVARARGMSDLSERTGIARGALYKALGPGGNPTLETMVKVARALGIELFAAPASTRREAAPEAIA